ncbi:lytic transglycosylase domain-containing protein [Pedobacter sp. SD-b]|uniref:Lytic transglycosylase domain-containing protein n=1 Tax=Pedobacter segetis TaxID=2793069 RepID=A0ABS1BG82_9SPHI|nr:lytic transglycosylase domain-containing protein [Pedobacter segetis]MBK0381853.1 lytic transglycosylase domain-containing protein [Pedobacter segetis]
MKKKIMITCGLVLVFFTLTKIFGYSYPAIHQPVVKADLDSIKSNLESNDENTLSFANELVPTGNKHIDHKMEQALKANSYKNMQTYQLHQNAEVWFPIIEPILKKYGIPEDFKYIPLIESGMKRGQYSPKGAAGLWQFMPQTGRDYGLTVNDKIDERMNVRLATVAAAKYIKDLYKQFDSWTLAAAAYNGGEGRMWRQIKSQKQDDYFKMKLNHETGKYVYSLISMKEVIEHPQDYGYKIRNARKLLALQN